ncbi:DeoR family transcriptional regulator [Serinibacter arcticus]|uniref:DeoR family transcriptional regulator n=1 Tax=Serinibacter arcticus TaxID=1655435 RepID=A0A2U1ZX37_9MICO|nr:DeoR/GlpR family DNA-binding transcription regulator [Serinibacter arcticus]PWD51482.1 DeoR family transcriptional regulator [Serinibacter arcticus]
MFTDERRQVILSVLAVHGSVSVADLARTVRASEITIRRDLRLLEEAGLLQRRRGGASLLKSAIDEPTYVEKSGVALSEKEEIAAAALDLVEDGDAIFIGAGTTTQALARLLTRRRLMVATTSLLVAGELADAHDVDLFMIGGVLRGNIRAVVGGDAEAALGRLRVRTTFLSGNGLTARHGLSTPNIHVASIDRAAMAAADRVVVLADHTKVGVDSTVQTVPAHRIDILVTDTLASPVELGHIGELGVDVTIAPSSVLGAVHRRARS